MNDQLDVNAGWVRYASGFRWLKAFAVCPDGSREPFDCAAIHVTPDDGRGLIVALAERIESEGVSICSLSMAAIAAAPSGAPADAHADVQNDAAAASPANQSVIVMCSGGANLLDLSLQRLVCGRH